MVHNITGQTKCVCLLGNPVAHSVSPQLHNHIFRSMNLPYVYIALDVPPQNLHSAIFTLRASFAGANVTIPHKVSALKYCDELSPLSESIGAVNTLYMKDGRLCGTTTDPQGFYKAIELAGHKFYGKDNVVILGSGATAQTLGAAMLIDAKCKTLTVAARSLDKAATLMSSLEKIKGANADITLNCCKLNSPESKTVFAKCTLLVNATSVGMHPNTDDTPLDKSFFHPSMTVFDAIYNPLQTRFLREAESANCKTQNGLPMLLFQGLASSYYWTGVKPCADLFLEHEIFSSCFARQRDVAQA